MENLRDPKTLCKYLLESCENHSAYTCILYLRDKILTGFHSCLLTGMALINLQKGFCTINHEKLLNKRSSVGFSAQSIVWFECYFSSRSFQVSIKNKFSNVARINWEIPHQSIFGIILFLIYVYDISQAAECDPLLNVDDYCLVYPDRDVEEIKQKLRKTFPNICDFFLNNKIIKKSILGPGFCTRKMASFLCSTDLDPDADPPQSRILDIEHLEKQGPKFWTSVKQKKSQCFVG